MELKLIRSDVKATGGNNKTVKASVVWIHAGQKTAIIAEKLVKKLELTQDTVIDGCNGRILDRNIRVIRPPKLIQGYTN